MKKNHFTIMLLTMAFLVGLSGVAAAYPNLGNNCSSCHADIPDRPAEPAPEPSLPVPPPNEAPLANAGPDQTVEEGEMVTLNGSNSSDPDDGIASYAWRQTAGATVDLSSITSAQPTFTAPTAGASGASCTFELTVTDKAGSSAKDTCIVNITPAPAAPENGAPVANAGPDQNVEPGAPVTLDGTNSTASLGDIVSYLWEQVGGTEVILSGTNEGTLTFTAPVDETASLTFQLTVEDNNGLKSTDTCIVNINSVIDELNPVPVADAGPDQSVQFGATVTLDGSNSSDPSDSSVSYSWKQLSGTPVTLARSTTAKPIFKTPRARRNNAPLNFELTVTDANGKQSSDTCIVQVTDTGAIGSGMGGNHQSKHTIDDGHIHNRVSMLGHFTGDGHNHTVGQGHTGHNHGKVVRGRASFTARGTVVKAPTRETPDRMTIRIQNAGRSLREHPAGSEVDFIISPYAFVNIYRVGPSTLDEVIPGSDVTVRGNVVESLDGTSVLYENKTIVVR